MKRLLIASLAILCLCSTSEAGPVRRLLAKVNSARPHLAKKLTKAVAVQVRK